MSSVNAITLYLIRHGQSLAPKEDFFQGQTDLPLTELGVRQAQAIADRLASEKLAAVYSSDLIRTVDTAEAIASRHNLSVIKSELVREAHLGEAQGLTVSEFEQKYPADYDLWKQDPVAHRPSGAERFEDVISRCGRFIERIGSIHEDGDEVAVVGHVGSISGIICAIFGLPVHFYLMISLANASLSRIDLGNRGSLRYLNDTCHLQILDKQQPAEYD